MEPEVAAPNQQHQMADKVQEALALAHALSNNDQKAFLVHLIDGIDLNVYRAVKESIVNRDRTKKNFINDDLPTELLVEIYSYLEPGAPLLHQRVCKGWQRRLTVSDVLRAPLTHWLDDTPMPLICELNNESSDAVVLKKLETMHRFRSGNPKWKLTFPIEHFWTARLRMLGNTFLLGPDQNGEIRLVNVHTGQMWSHYITDESGREASRYIWQSTKSAFLHLEDEVEPYYYALDLDNQSCNSLPCPLDRLLSFTAFDRYAAILHGRDLLSQGAEILLWEWRSDQTFVLKVPGIVDLLPDDFVDRDLTDHLVKVHMSKDETAVTLIVLGKFQEDWQHDEQCVVLMFRLEFDKDAVDPTTRAVSSEIEVKVAYRAYDNASAGSNNIEVPVQYLGWSKNAAYGVDNKGNCYFSDSEEFLSIDCECAKFSIVEIGGATDIHNSEAFVYKGVTYSVPYGSISSVRLTQNLTADDPVYTLFHDSDIVPGFVSPGPDGGTWWTGSRTDPFIVGDPRVLFLGSHDKVTIAAFDPDVNIPHRFLVDEWQPTFPTDLDSSDRPIVLQGGSGRRPHGYGAGGEGASNDEAADDQDGNDDDARVYTGWD